MVSPSPILYEVSLSPSTALDGSSDVTRFISIKGDCVAFFPKAKLYGIVKGGVFSSIVGNTALPSKLRHRSASLLTIDIRHIPRNSMFWFSSVNVRVS